MRKVITSLFVSVALCAPSAAWAGHYDTDIAASYYDEEYQTEDDCEEELAELRRSMRDRNDYMGRDRGQSNKAFNQRYQCEYDEETDSYMIEDSEA